MSERCTIIWSERGSSLVAVSLFIIAFGLLSAAAIQLYRQYDTARNAIETQKTLDSLRAAMIQYYAQNARFPCPAPFDSDPEDEDFAKEASSPCTSNNTLNNGSYGHGGGGGGGGGHHHSGPPHQHGNNKPPGWNWGAGGGQTGTVRTDGFSGERIRIGAIPTRSMNLPDKAGIDAYGHRIVYAVMERMASPGAASIVDPGAIDLEDPNDNESNQDQVIVLIFSHGGDIRGAWDISGNWIEGCDETILSGENCDNDYAFINTINRNDRDSTNHFTHRVVYISRDVIGK